MTILFFSIFGVSLFTLAVSGVDGGQMTFSVSFALFGIIWSTTGLIFRLDWRAFCFDQQRPVTLGLVYDRGIHYLF